MKKLFSYSRVAQFASLWLVVFVFSFYNAHADDIKKAFKLLYTGIYEEALMNFYDELKTEPDNAAANYGIAKIFSAKDFKRYSLDTAFLFAQRAYAKTPLKPDDKNTKKFLELGVRDFTIQELYNLIQKEAFDVAIKANTIAAYGQFIQLYKDKDLIKQAVAKRNALAFENAKLTNTPSALKEFLKSYPEAIEAASATLLYEELLYKSITSDGKPESFKKYMDQYPKGLYVEEARTVYEQRGLEQILKQNTLDGYVKFERSYPNHPGVGRVQDSIFTHLTKEGEIGFYKDFIRFHPKNRNIFQAWRDIYLLETIHDSPEEHEAFLKNYPEYPFKTDVEQNLERAKIEYKVFNRDEKSGFINAQNGEVIIPFQFSEANDFSCGFAAVTNDDCSNTCRYFYINRKGEQAFDGTYDYAGDFVEGRAVVGLGNCAEDSCKYGVIDKRGKFIIPPIYDEVDDVSEGFYAVAMNEQYGYLDKKGRLAVLFKYKDGLGFKEGVAAVKTDSGWTFIDTNGIKVIDAYYIKTSSFAGGVCAVTKNDSTWGYITHTGNWAIPPTYAEAGDFEKGFAVVATRERDKKNKNLFVFQRFKIDSSGKVIEKLLAPTAPKPVRKKKK